MQARMNNELGQANDTYYGHLRQDVLALVPAEALTLLSVGCGAGRTEGELVAQGRRVIGIEQDPGAAEQARRRGVEVCEGNALTVDIASSCDSFDCLIYADVLEHIFDPEEVLRRHVALLREGGAVIISVPNFRYWRVFWQLFVRGRIDYESAGILDRTHVRLTTRKLVEQWFEGLGLTKTSSRYNISGRRYKLLSIATLHLGREFFAQQVLLAARKM